MTLAYDRRLLGYEKRKLRQRHAVQPPKRNKISLRTTLLLTYGALFAIALIYVRF